MVGLLPNDALVSDAPQHSGLRFFDRDKNLRDQRPQIAQAIRARANKNDTE
jgi:hypothetical protein